MSFGEISPANVHSRDPQSLLAPHQGELSPAINGGLKRYIANLVNGSPGNLSFGAVAELAVGIGEYEAENPLFSATPFRYACLPDLPELGVRFTGEATIKSATKNMRYMQERFGVETFAAEAPNPRSTRALTWVAPIDDDYQLHVRGASGAGTFSIDFGLGVIDYEKRTPKYKELWRAGVDTVETESSLGARFIRTGAGIKPGDELKSQAFDTFRKRHKILPQRLLGILGLYFMRELEPDYAVALTSEGARRYSTLGRSKGHCDYDGIFQDIGFEPTADSKWLAIGDFTEGFYKAITRARVKRREESVLATAAEALQSMKQLNQDQEDRPLFEFCSDERREVIEREVAVVLRQRRAA